MSEDYNYTPINSDVTPINPKSPDSGLGVSVKTKTDSYEYSPINGDKAITDAPSIVNNALLDSKIDFAALGVSTNVTTGDYEKYGYGITSAFDYKERAAQNQSNAAKFGNAAARIPFGIAGKVIEGTGYLLGGSTALIGEGIDRVTSYDQTAGEGFNIAFENPLAKSGRAIQDWMTGITEIHNRKAYTDGDAFTRFFMAENWAQISDGIQFLISAMIPAMGVSKLGTGAKLARGLSKPMLKASSNQAKNGYKVYKQINNLKLAGKHGEAKALLDSSVKAGTISKQAVGALNKLGATTDFLTVHATNTSMESMFEAYESGIHRYESLEGKTNPFTGNEYTLNELEDERLKASANTFLYNTALLSVTNLPETIALGKIFSTFKKSKVGKAIRNNKNKSIDDILTPKSKVKNVFKTAGAFTLGASITGAFEAMEENGQLAIQNAVKDGDITPMEVLTNIRNNFSTEEGKEAMMLGATIGFIPGGISRIGSNRRAATRKILDTINDSTTKGFLESLGRDYFQTTEDKDGKVVIVKDKEGNPIIDLAKFNTTFALKAGSSLADRVLNHAARTNNSSAYTIGQKLKLMETLLTSKRISDEANDKETLKGIVKNLIETANTDLKTIASIVGNDVNSKEIEEFAAEIESFIDVAYGTYNKKQLEVQASNNKEINKSESKRNFAINNGFTFELQSILLSDLSNVLRENITNETVDKNKHIKLKQLKEVSEQEDFKELEKLQQDSVKNEIKVLEEELKDKAEPKTSQNIDDTVSLITMLELMSDDYVLKSNLTEKVDSYVKQYNKLEKEQTEANEKSKDERKDGLDKKFNSLLQKLSIDKDNNLSVHYDELKILAEQLDAEFGEKRSLKNKLSKVTEYTDKLNNRVDILRSVNRESAAKVTNETKTEKQAFVEKAIVDESKHYSLSEDGTHYIYDEDTKEVDGEVVQVKYRRQSNASDNPSGTIEDDIAKDTADNSYLDNGNIVDEIAKNVIKGDKYTFEQFKSLFGEILSESEFNKIVSEAKRLRGELVNEGDLVLTDILVGTFRSKKNIKIAGEIDILIITADGTVKIYDIKSMKSADTVNNKETTSKWYKQLNHYKLFLDFTILQRKVNSTVQEFGIIPIGIIDKVDDSGKEHKEIFKVSDKPLPLSETYIPDATDKPVIEDTTPSEETVETNVSEQSKTQDGTDVIEEKKEEVINEENTTGTISLFKVQKEQDSMMSKSYNNIIFNNLTKNIKSYLSEAFSKYKLDSKTESKLALAAEALGRHIRSLNLYDTSVNINLMMERIVSDIKLTNPHLLVDIQNIFNDVAGEEASLLYEQFVDKIEHYGQEIDNYDKSDTVKPNIYMFALELYNDILKAIGEIKGITAKAIKEFDVTKITDEVTDKDLILFKLQILEDIMKVNVKSSEADYKNKVDLIFNKYMLKMSGVSDIKSRQKFTNVILGFKQLYTSTYNNYTVKKQATKTTQEKVVLNEQDLTLENEGKGYNIFHILNNKFKTKEGEEEAYIRDEFGNIHFTNTESGKAAQALYHKLESLATQENSDNPAKVVVKDNDLYLVEGDTETFLGRKNEINYPIAELSLFNALDSLQNIDAKAHNEVTIDIQNINARLKHTDVVGDDVYIALYNKVMDRLDAIAKEGTHIFFFSTGSRVVALPNADSIIPSDLMKKYTTAFNNPVQAGKYLARILEHGHIRTKYKNGYYNDYLILKSMEEGAVEFEVSSVENGAIVNEYKDKSNPIFRKLNDNVFVGMFDLTEGFLGLSKRGSNSIESFTDAGQKFISPTKTYNGSDLFFVIKGINGKNVPIKLSRRKLTTKDAAEVKSILDKISSSYDGTLKSDNIETLINQLSSYIPFASKSKDNSYLNVDYNSNTINIKTTGGNITFSFRRGFTETYTTSPVGKRNIYDSFDDIDVQLNTVVTATSKNINYDDIKSTEDVNRLIDSGDILVSLAVTKDYNGNTIGAFAPVGRHNNNPIIIRIAEPKNKKPTDSEINNVTNNPDGKPTVDSIDEYEDDPDGYDNDVLDNNSLIDQHSEKLYTINVSRAEEWIDEHLGSNANIKWFTSYLTKGNSYIQGITRDSAMHLATYAEYGTEYHESFHIVFNNLITEEERKAIMLEASVYYGTEDEAVLEEMLADDYRDFEITRQAPETLPEKIKAIFNELIKRIQYLIDNTVYINDFFNRISNGEFRTEALTKKESEFILKQGISVTEWNTLTAEEKEKIKYCNGFGKIKVPKAANGMQSGFTKGGKWNVVKDLKGLPSHKKGGVQLNVNKGNVNFTKGDSNIHAKYGLIIPNIK